VVLEHALWGWRGAGLGVSARPAGGNVGKSEEQIFREVEEGGGVRRRGGEGGGEGD